LLSTFKHHWHTTGSWKNASGFLKSPGNFFNQDSGNPVVGVVPNAVKALSTLDLCVDNV